MSKLRDEIIGDPLGRNYAAMTDQQVVEDLHLLNRSRNLTSMSPSKILNQIDIGEWNALTDADQRRIWDVLHIGEINPFGVEATIFINVFGGPSTTIANLQAARIESISRVTELGLGVVRVGEVERART